MMGKIHGGEPHPQDVKDSKRLQSGTEIDEEEHFKGSTARMK
jgi:hypothetical protein